MINKVWEIECMFLIGKISFFFYMVKRKNLGSLITF